MGQRTVVFWEELVKALQEQYGPPEYQNPDEYLYSIKQIGSVHDYRSEFAKRQAHVKNWPDHCLLEVFINGLKEELKADVRIHKPRTVYRATSLALEFEAKLKTTQGPKSSSASTVHQRPNYLANVNRGSFSSSPSTNRSPIVSSSGTKPILFPPPFEIQRRRDKGLCYRCGDTFRPGHRCSSSLALMEIAEDGEEIVPPLTEEADT